LLPYHVVADYEAEEDDRILDSDISAKPLSRSQQWDNNIYNKVAEFTATFEKQVFDFNDISRKQAIGEFRSEERLMVEQILIQEERRALYEARVELETRKKEGLEAQAASLRMAAIVQAEQLRAESQSRAEMMATGPIRASAIRGHEFFDQEQERYEKEPSEDFLNDEERDNGDMGIQSDWREGRGFDLNIC
ncbi:GLTSCR protein, partial [Tanacetum coccineum]